MKGTRLIWYKTTYFVIKDKDSKYIMVSPNFPTIGGFKSEEDAIGRVDADLHCEAADYAETFIRQDKLVIQTDQVSTLLDFHYYADDNLHAFVGQKIPYYDENDNVTGVLCVTKELTSQYFKRICHQLKRIDKRFQGEIQHGSYYLNSPCAEANISNKEFECLFYLVRGKTAKGISEMMHLSRRTVEYHIVRLKEKLNCTTRSDLVEKAIDNGYVHIFPGRLISRDFIKMLDEF